MQNPVHVQVRQGMGKEGRKVSIYAKIKNGNVVVMEMLVNDMRKVQEWLERHPGEYDAYEIKYKREKGWQDNG